MKHAVDCCCIDVEGPTVIDERGNYPGVAGEKTTCIGDGPFEHDDVAVVNAYFLKRETGKIRRARNDRRIIQSVVLAHLLTSRVKFDSDGDCSAVVDRRCAKG